MDHDHDRDHQKGDIMTTYVSSTSSATQLAKWTSSDGLATAMVCRTDRIDTDGKRAWKWTLSYPTRFNVHGECDIAVNYTCVDAEDIRTPGDPDPAEVLRSLSSFLDAWDEAQRYPNSENRDLFPTSCEPFLNYCEEFASDMIEDEEMS